MEKIYYQDNDIIITDKLIKFRGNYINLYEIQSIQTEYIESNKTIKGIFAIMGFVLFPIIAAIFENYQAFILIMGAIIMILGLLALDDKTICKLNIYTDNDTICILESDDCENVRKIETILNDLVKNK